MKMIRITMIRFLKSLFGSHRPPNWSYEILAGTTPAGERVYTFRVWWPGQGWVYPEKAIPTGQPTPLKSKAQAFKSYDLAENQAKLFAANWKFKVEGEVQWDEDD